MTWQSMKSCPYGSPLMLIFEGGIYEDEDGTHLINEICLGFALHGGKLHIDGYFINKFLEDPIGWQYAPAPSKNGLRYTEAKTHGKPFLSIVD
jgi:hypothetical protein